MRKRSLIISLSAVAALAALSTPSYAERIDVRSGDSLQAAIDAAQPGDTIVVRGRLVESVTLSGKSDLTIRGAGRRASVEASSPTGPTFTVDACNDITIERLDITARHRGALEIGRSMDILVTRNSIRGPSSYAPAVVVGESSAVTISRNRFSGDIVVGVSLGKHRAPAERSIVARNKFRRNGGTSVIVHGSQNLVLRNSFKKGGSAVVLHGDDPVQTNVVRRNRIAGPRGHAVHVVDGAAVIDDNSVRLAVLDSVQIDAEGAIVSANNVKAACRHGVHVDASLVSVVGNKIVRSTDDAIRITGDENVVRNNVLKGSGESAIDLDGDENLINGNDIGGNDEPVSVEGDANVGSDIE